MDCSQCMTGMRPQTVGPSTILWTCPACGYVEVTHGQI